MIREVNPKHKILLIEPNNNQHGDPSTFSETCCHLFNTALHPGSVPTTSQVGALVEKIINGDLGITIPGDPHSNQFKQEFDKLVMGLVKSGTVDNIPDHNRGQYSANTARVGGENIKILGITISMNTRGNKAKINFSNLLWYAPINIQTFELTGMSLDQARNTAANMAIQRGADYLLFLDSDIFVDKHFLTNMMKMMKDNNADIVVSNYPFKDTDKLMSTARFMKIVDNKAINCYGCHKITDKDLNDPKQYRFVMAGLGAILISTDMLKNMGKPHFSTKTTNIRHVGEDAHFFHKAKALGAKIYVTVDTPIIHVNLEKGKMLPYGIEEDVKLILPQIGNNSIPTPTQLSQTQGIELGVQQNHIQKPTPTHPQHPTYK